MIFQSLDKLLFEVILEMIFQYLDMLVLEVILEMIFESLGKLLLVHHKNLMMTFVQQAIHGMIY
jgi:hypothetical protein